MAQFKFEAKHGCNISIELDGFRCFFNPQHEDTRHSYPLADAIFISETYEPLNDGREHSETYEELAGATVYAKEAACFFMSPSLMDYFSKKHAATDRNDNPHLLALENAILSKSERFDIDAKKSIGNFEVSLLQLSTDTKETFATKFAYQIEFKGRRILVASPASHSHIDLSNIAIDYLILGFVTRGASLEAFERVIKSTSARTVILPRRLKKKIPKSSSKDEGQIKNTPELIFHDRYKDSWEDPR